MPASSDYVFVTGYIDLHSLEKRPGTKSTPDYLQYAAPLLKSGQRVCCFCQSDKMPQIERLVCDNGNSVQLIEFNADRLRYNNSRFFDARLPKIRNQSKDTHWYLAVNSQKVFWLQEAAKAYPNVEQFCWVDFGINHMLQLSERKFSATLSRFAPCEAGKVTAPALFPSRRANLDIAIEEFGLAHLAGSILAGRRAEIDWMAEQQHLIIEQILQQYSAATWECNIWSLIADMYPEKFKTYRARWDKTMLTNFPSSSFARRLLQRI